MQNLDPLVWGAQDSWEAENLPKARDHRYVSGKITGGSNELSSFPLHQKMLAKNTDLSTTSKF